MKHAIISDIHGNIDALSAVLKDAEHCSVDRYIFAGDYCTYLPYPNEVVHVLKNLKNAVIVQGNEDSRLSTFAKQNQPTWTDGQFQAIYWCCRTIEKENCRYLDSLPQKLTITDHHMNLFVTHFSSDFIGNAEQKEFSSLKVAERYKNTLVSREVFFQDMGNYLSRDPDFLTTVQSLSDGIYIFGHTHVQWNAQFGNKYFINPGSCGLPLDGAQTAPYTILDIEDDVMKVIERRVVYDLDGLIHRFRNSSLHEAANV